MPDSAPRFVIDALQQYIDRAVSEVRLAHHMSAAESFDRGRELGRLQQWVYEQKKSATVDETTST